MPPAAGPAVPGSCHHPRQRQDRRRHRRPRLPARYPARDRGSPLGL